MIRAKRHGYTLIEILIVMAIVALLVLATILSLSKERLKAEDVRVKTDLERLKIAFAEYYNDNHCYPPVEWFDGAEDCGAPHMQPYLSAIACDKHTGLPYVLEKDATGCGWFKLYGELALPESDREALALCSTPGSNLGNYGVSSSNVTVQISCGGGSPLASSTPTASSSPAASATPAPSSNLPPVDPDYAYYCQGAANCTSYDPYKFYCVPAFTDPNCGAGCSEASACIVR